METPINYEQSQGIIAILDALGAASFSDAEVTRFLEARSSVLESFEVKKGQSTVMSKDDISTFTFNDTLVIVYSVDHVPNLREVKSFFMLIRKVLIDSLVNGILFRGSIAIGSFYKHDETNTIMGQAVTDAAAWYDKADWFGAHATPKATLVIDALLEKARENPKWIVTPYDVPFKDGAKWRLKTVNWPRGFFTSGVTPCASGEREKAKLLELLSSFAVPAGSQTKYYNSLRYYDVASKYKRLVPKKRTGG